MIIYFAGEPGGSKRERESKILSLGIVHRLQTFFYLEQLKETIRIINERILLRKS